MKKHVLLGMLAVFLLPVSGIGQTKIWDETEQQKEKRMEWWIQNRFGMFIHWGLYSSLARHEWVMRYEKIAPEEYEKYMAFFEPDLYNPKEWARMAKEAGMKYAVITTKHHEGFCMFETKYTDYQSKKAPLCRKDLIKEWVDAFRAEGLKVGFYYSLLDWHHPDFSIDRLHPLAPKDTSMYEEMNKNRNMNRYRKFVKNQVTELLTNYGKIDLLWLDYSYPTGSFGKGRKDWDSEELVKLVRRLQPGIIINDRADLLDVPGGWDFSTPEQYKVSQWPERNGKRIAWETCQTFSGSWGYYRDETTWKNTHQLLTLLIESVSKGGNLLLNVGPTARGTFDARAQERLKGIGEWMCVNSPSIYGCTEAPEGFKVPENTILTYNPKTNRLYVHLLDYPLERILLEGYAGKVKYAQFLHDRSELKFGKAPFSITYQEELKKEDLSLELPVIKPNIEIPVIELILNE